jgi:hypothetical protein
LRFAPFLIAFCILAAATRPTTGGAQFGIRDVAAKPGGPAQEAKGAVVRGTSDYLAFEARAGQTSSISINSLEHNAVFQIYLPGFVISSQAGAPVAGDTLPNAGIVDDATKWLGKLTASGKYLIVIGSSRGNAAYRLTISLR